MLNCSMKKVVLAPRLYEVDAYNSRGVFIFDKESVIMKKWQILEFDGKPYYAFVPEDDTPLPDEDLPQTVEEQAEEKIEEENSNLMLKDESLFHDDASQYYDSMEEKCYDNETVFNGDVEENEEQESKSITLLNGIDEAIEDKTSVGDLYQVKMQGSVVTIEKLSSSEIDKKVDEYQIENNDEGEIEYLEDEIEPPEMEFFENDMSPTKTSNKSPKNAGGALKCKLCSEMFDSDISFRKHVAWTHKKKVCIKEDGAFICAVCDYRTLKKSLFAAHLERKHETWSRKRSNNTLFPCAACGFVCRSKHSLQSHFIRKHTDRYEHQCNFCPKKFKVKGDLTNHIRFHHKEKPVKCDVCGKLCLNSGSLYVHQKWAHYKPKYECHICKRRMVTQENLNQHLLTQHEKRDKIVCAECGKTFTKKDSFKRHMVVHTGSKPHSCLICSKPFARRSQLRQHLLIHTGKRPFVCDICGKAFTQKPGLICHRKIHPGPHPPLPVMPIADIVKEFTDGYVQEINSRENEEKMEEEA